MTVGRVHDVLIVGAGPAGLVAGMYLGRYCRDVRIVHDRASRAAMIPESHNIPGFPDGLGGNELLARMERHAQRYNCQISEAHISSARREGGLFILEDKQGTALHARALIMATGVHMRRFPLEENVHQHAIDAGVLRYCPICDGFEHRGQKTAVIGEGDHAAKEALFLAGYTNDITLLLTHQAKLSEQLASCLAKAKVRVVFAQTFVVRPSPADIAISWGADEHEIFDVLYPALGCRPNNQLLKMLGASIDADGCPVPEAMRDAGIPGLFVAGDLMPGLDQISVAIGHGAIAATAAHNWLREQDGMYPHD